MEKKSQVDIAYDYIKNAIIGKVYFPGNRLVEEELVRSTGVSRTSVRTALTRLRYEGIVEGSANRGTMVARHSLEDIKSAFAIRQVLEIGAFEQAVHNITPDALERMRRNNENLRKVTENFSISEFVRYNRAFHWEIAAASHNKYYEKYLDEVYSNIAVYLLFYNSSMDDTRSVKLHGDIIQALVDKDADAGARAIIADNRCAIEDADYKL